jgi:tol-pal system protein YbgF
MRFAVRRIALTSALAVLVLGLGTGPVSAQMDSRVLYDRIERLERDIQVLNQNMARGAQGGSTVIRSPAAGGGSAYVPAEPAPLSPGMMQRLDDRVDQLEEQVRQLTGRIEEAQHRADTTAKQLERMQADIELRFKDLQGGPAPAAGAPASATLGAPNAGGNSAGAGGPTPGPQVLGAMPEADMKKALGGQAAASAPQPKDAQGLYDLAYAAAQRGDYAAAEKGFQDFLAKHGNHALAGNASYWLGDIAYVKKDFGTAAATFLEAYKKHTKHTKAADMIYKAGSAFGQMGKTKEACTALGILFKDHADMPDRVKRAATAEKQKYGCK